KRRVSVGVRATRDGDHGRELGVAQGGKSARHSREDERKNKCRTGARPGRITGRSGTDGGKDARADDRTDAESGHVDRPERFLQPVLGFLGLGDQFIEGLCAKQGVEHASGILATKSTKGKPLSTPVHLLWLI